MAWVVSVPAMDKPVATCQVVAKDIMNWVATMNGYYLYVFHACQWCSPFHQNNVQGRKCLDRIT